MIKFLSKPKILINWGDYSLKKKKKLPRGTRTLMSQLDDSQKSFSRSDFVDVDSGQREEI